VTSQGGATHACDNGVVTLPAAVVTLVASNDAGGEDTWTGGDKVLELAFNARFAGTNSGDSPDLPLSAADPLQGYQRHEGRGQLRLRL